MVEEIYGKELVGYKKLEQSMYFTSLDTVSHGWPDSRNHIVQAVMPAGTTLNGSTECFHTVLHNNIIWINDNE